jgi:hypothetical protein
MRLPRVRFTVRRMMAAIAVLPISWCMLLGIADLIGYADHARMERECRDGAAIWESKNEPGRATHELELAEEQRQMKLACLSRGLTVLALLTLGGSAGLIGMAVRARHAPACPDDAGAMNRLASVCSAVAKVIFVSLLLGGGIYLVILLLVMAGDD